MREIKIRIETLEGKRPVYIIKASKFNKLHKKFGGWFFYREEGGKILIKPSDDEGFQIMKQTIGRNHFKEVNESI